MRIVIVGYGPGGVAAATSAKMFDRSAEVSIFTKENLEAHRKPGASMALESPGTTDLMIPEWSMQSLREKGIKISTGVNVESIDSGAKTIIVEENGSLSEIQYDKLILATGGTPSIPKINGTDLKGVFTIQDMSDTSLIGSQLGNLNEIFVVGAGFSGLEVAEKLLDLGKEVHLVVRSRLMRRLLEEPLSEELLSRISKRLTIYTGASPEEVIGSDKVEAIKLNGEVLKADAVLFMTGVKPNIQLATSMGLEIGDLGGVKVSNLLETSVKDVYSVGDCIEMFDRLTGKPVLMPIGSVAARAGRQAGVAAVGGTKVYDDVSIRFQYDRIFDTDIVCVGHSSATALALDIDCRVEYYEDPSEFTKIALVSTRDGTIIGGQVIASRMGSRTGFQIYQMVERGAKMPRIGFTSPLLEPLHKRMKDLLEETLGPIQ